MIRAYLLWGEGASEYISERRIMVGLIVWKATGKVEGWRLPFTLVTFTYGQLRKMEEKRSEDVMGMPLSSLPDS